MMTPVKVQSMLAAESGQELATRVAQTYQQAPSNEVITQLPGESHAEFIKRRNNIYSRRKRQREKNDRIISQSKAHCCQEFNKA